MSALCKTGLQAPTDVAEVTEPPGDLQGLVMPEAACDHQGCRGSGRVSGGPSQPVPRWGPGMLWSVLPQPTQSLLP